MESGLTRLFIQSVIVIVILTGLNFAILALSFKLYTEMFKQIAQDKRGKG